LFGIVPIMKKDATREARTDKRVQRTQRLLRDALVSLVHEKSYDAIAVREILDRADVGRSAFYAHYEGKDALLASTIQELLHASSPRGLPPDVPRSARALWFSLPVFEHVHRFRQAGHQGIGDAERATLHRHLRPALVEQVIEDVQSITRTGEAQGSAIPPELIADYIVETFLLVLDWWTRSKHALTPREADDLFRALVLPTLAAAESGST
jgi:AcrR family transcriptional regulator